MAQGVIAVLDGDWGCRALLDDVLTSIGYQTVLWEPEMDPFALIERCQPSLLILDTWLEVRHDGWALLQQLWRSPATAAIPVLVCTSDPRWQPEPLPGQAQARYTVLEKPFDLADLLERVAPMLVPPGAAGDVGADTLPLDSHQVCNVAAGVLAATATG